jgi:hypothetical protein
MSVPLFSYAEVIPENSKDSYTAHDNVDFMLVAGEGRALNGGSIRIEGELEALYNGTPLNSAGNIDKEIYYNNTAGAHSCFEGIQTTIGGQVIENIGFDYPRYVSMATKATSEQGDIGNNANQVCELKTSYQTATNQLLKGEVVEEQLTNAIRNNPDFSIKPMICLNSTLRAMKFSKTGVIRLTLNMARVNSIFYGKDVDANLKYSVKDLRVTFTSVPESEASDEPILMRTKLPMKQSIQSSFANVALRVPAVCSSVSCSFMEQAQENDPKKDNLQMATVPSLKSVSYSFNDITSSLVTFKLKSNPEFIQGYIDSFLDTGLNALSPSNQANGEGYGVGVSFGGQVDLRDRKFSVELNSGITNANPFIIYLYFHSSISL